ncbi:MAG: phytanoyl-CoA dioxygenase family protein, partial [SAR324 cluster bacterium]|nr:phytanoyl-CoA dioxygenase family protein [SAR324 cluster bacterium]
MKNITHADKQFFDMFGFLIIRNVLSRDEIKLIEKEYDYGFKKTLEHHSNGFGMRKQFNWSNLNEMCPNLCSLPYQNIILRTVKTLMGHKIFPYLCNSNNFNGPATEWHTDQTADTDCFAVKVIFYLDELDENSGGLRFLPCSQREPLNSDLWDFGLHGSNETDIKDYKSKSGLEIDQVPSYYCRTNPGDMVIFNLKIWHSSLGGGKNRRNITLNYSKYPEKDSEIESLKALAIQSKQT